MHDAKNTVNLNLDFYKVLEYFRHLGPDWSGDPTGALHMYSCTAVARGSLCCTAVRVATTGMVVEVS